MLHIAVVYFSQEGATHSLATSLCAGIGEVSGVQPIACRINGDDIVRGRYTHFGTLEIVDTCEGVVFGSPTYMGGPAAQFKAFADATSDRWESQKWAGKIASGFTCGSSPGGDQLATLQYFTLLAAQHGMLWVNLDVVSTRDSSGRNRLGTQLGASALTVSGPVDTSDLATAHYLGSRVAQTVVKMNDGNGTATEA